jgi:hypothetical protein
VRLLNAGPAPATAQLGRRERIRTLIFRMKPSVEIPVILSSGYGEVSSRAGIEEGPPM